MKKNNSGNIVIMMGSMLMMAALAIAVSNIETDNKSGERAEELLMRVKQEMPETQPAVVSDAVHTTGGYDVFDRYIPRDDETYYADARDPLIEIEDSMYVGILTIPGLTIELPVYDELSYDNLKNSPCRYKGSVRKGNIIIAAHNYSSHFGSIPQMITGDVIYFTDADGYVREYSVIQTETVNGSDVEAMERGSDEWDLTIFTCSISGINRIAVRASLV